MKKIIKLFVILLSIATISSCALLDSTSTIEFTALPKPTYTLNSNTEKVMNEIIVKINGKDEYTLTKLNGMVPGASFSGLDFTSLGSKVLTVTYDTITISFTYQVITEEAAQTASIAWYNTTDTEFHLQTAADLRGLAKLVNDDNHFEGKTIYLDNDIDLAYVTWTPIGLGARKSSQAGKYPWDFNKTIGFLGTFDGNNHIINGLTNAGYNPTTNTYITSSADATIEGYAFGLFGSICTYEKNENTTETSIKNIKFTNIDINADSSYKTEIVDGKSVNYYKGADATGAVLGFLGGKSSVFVENCQVLTGHIFAIDGAGGIVGRQDNNSTIKSTKNSWNNINVKIKNCSNAAEIKITRKANNGKCGGILGFACFSNIFLQSCSNSGIVNVPESNYYGELVGYLQPGSYTLLFNDCTFRSGVAIKISTISSGTWPTDYNKDLIQESEKVL